MRLGTIFLITVLFVSSACAGTSGVLEGKIKDKHSGEALIGVSVSIIGTSMGGATDAEGRFQVSNVEAGTYDVRFSSVGYQTLVYRDVVIRPDLHTSVSVEMVQSAVELGEIEVLAERPLIEKDVTSTNFSYGGSQVEKLPIQKDRKSVV